MSCLNKSPDLLKWCLVDFEGWLAVFKGARNSLQSDWIATSWFEFIIEHLGITFAASFIWLKAPLTFTWQGRWARLLSKLAMKVNLLAMTCRWYHLSPFRREFPHQWKGFPRLDYGGGIVLRGLWGPLRSIKAHHLTEDDLRSLTGDVVVIV